MEYLFANTKKEEAVSVLEKALGELLQDLFDHRMRERDKSFDDLVAIDVAEILSRNPPTNADIFIGFMKAPLEGAIKISIKKIGRLLHEIGGIDLMREIQERVCNIPLKCYGHEKTGSNYGRQSSVVTHAWDGLGGEWWA